MRKDVKIGLGIGGVLLAVLIVYLLVPKTDETSDYARNGDSANSSEERGEDAAPTSTGGSQSVASGDGVGSGTPADQGGASAAQAPDHRAAGQSTVASNAGEGDAGSPPPIDWANVFATGIVPDEAKVGLVARSAPEDIFADKAPGSTQTGASDVPDYGTARGQSVTPVNVAAPTPPAANAVQSGGAPKGGVTEHVVQQGENLSMIASVAYGDARLYREILKANPTLDERKLKPGTVIKMPNASAFVTAKPQQAQARQAQARQEPAVDSAKEYRVAQGDSLHKIALKLYGKATKADALYELNKDKIGDDSARLKLGMVLKLPEAPAAAHSAR